MDFEEATCRVGPGLAYSQGVRLVLQAVQGGPSSGHLTCLCLHVRQPRRDLGCERRGGITDMIDPVHIIVTECNVSRHACRKGGKERKARTEEG